MSDTFFNYMELLKDVPPITITEDMLFNGQVVPEIWIPIDDTIIKNILPGYFVSNYGRLYSIIPSTCGTGIMHPSKVRREKEYLQISLRLKGNDYKTMKIHRLVMITFNYNYNYEKFEVNHKDNNPTHNWLWNLEWCNSSYNTIYAITNGKKKVFNNDYKVLDIDTLDKAFKDYNNGYSIDEISSMYNLNKTSFRLMISGVNRKYLKEKYNLIKESIIDKSFGADTKLVEDHIMYLIVNYVPLDKIIETILNEYYFENKDAAIIKVKRIYRNIIQNIGTFNDYLVRE